MNRKWRTALAVTVITVGAVASMGAAYAAVGTQSDPLITLSYLNDKFTPSVLEQVDDAVAKQNTTLQTQLEQKIQAFTQDIQARLDAAGGSSALPGSSGVYSVVSLSSGQTLLGDIGCEVMLRVGAAVCVTDSEPGLIDMTDGAVLASGKSLVKNHLYMMTIENRGVRATTDIKLLVRGSYTIQ